MNRHQSPQNLAVKGTDLWITRVATVRPLSPDPYMRYSTPRLYGTSVPMNKDVLLRSSVSARRPKSILTLLPLRTLIGARSSGQLESVG